MANIQAEWEKIDRDIGRAMSLGDRAAKRPMGTYVWSKKPCQAAYECQYWRKQLKMHAYNINSSEQALEEMRQIAQ